MLKDLIIRKVVLSVHGVLALMLGLAFLYLGATMTNLLFEAVAVAIAIVLATAALILAAITDWFAAFSEGRKRVHRFVFYILAGVALAVTGVVLGYYPAVTMQWLLVLAAIHSLTFGISAFAFAMRPALQPIRPRCLYILGTLSILFSGVTASMATLDIGNPAAAATLGVYLCFVGAKMFFFAWNLDRAISHQEPLPATAHRRQFAG